MSSLCIMTMYKYSIIHTVVKCFLCNAMKNILIHFKICCRTQMGQCWIPMVKLPLNHWRQSLLSQASPSLEFQNLSGQVRGEQWNVAYQTSVRLLMLSPIISSQTKSVSEDLTNGWCDRWRTGWTAELRGFCAVAQRPGWKPATSDLPQGFGCWVQSCSICSSMTKKKG